jgi:hypothetical protein
MLFTVIESLSKQGTDKSPAFPTQNLQKSLGGRVRFPTWINILGSSSKNSCSVDVTAPYRTVKLSRPSTDGVTLNIRLPGVANTHEEFDSTSDVASTAKFPEP